MILARYTASTRHGITTWNQGCLEVGTMLGILANTIPTAFYLIIRICSDPTLLEDLRHELESTSVSTNSGEKTRQLRVMTMREECGLLLSTFQELLRVHALGIGSRFVREDVVLDNQYLLKKGMIVQMPMAVMHSDPAIWGPDVHDFQPNRFLKHQPNVKEPKQNLAGYRPFGGGASLCPGRHFVTLETLALTASLILRFDLVPVSGEWTIPPQKQESLATNVFPPEHDIKVRFSPRKNYEDVQWSFIMA